MNIISTVHLSSSAFHKLYNFVRNVSSSSIMEHSSLQLQHVVISPIVIIIIYIKYHKYVPYPPIAISIYTQDTTHPLLMNFKDKLGNKM